MDAKRRLRAQVRAGRTQPRAGHADALRDVALPHLSTARVVAAYAAVGGEPDPGPLRAALRDRGVVVLLPLVRGGTLGWGPDDGDLVPGPALPSGLRVPEPRTTGRLGLADADVVLVPALAVDRSGARLGQGGGFYDRALTALTALTAPAAPGPAVPGPLLVAVVHDDELLGHGQVPVEAHDHRVDAVLTPTRWTTVR